jgi:hypothetical protein
MEELTRAKKLEVTQYYLLGYSIEDCGRTTLHTLGGIEP